MSAAVIADAQGIYGFGLGAALCALLMWVVFAR